jgi:hypothetical protein
MLSHGGSRLNASKPEANPKTRCPLIKSWTRFRQKYVTLRRLLWRWKFQKSIIESPFKLFQTLSDSVAQSISNDHKKKLVSPEDLRIPNARGGNWRKQKHKQTTSLSKRENMHGLAWAACLTLWGSRGIYVPRRWTLRPGITCSGTYSLKFLLKKNWLKGICIGSCKKLLV